MSAPNTASPSAITAKIAHSGPPNASTSAAQVITSTSRAVPASTGSTTWPAPCEEKYSTIQWTDVWLKEGDRVRVEIDKLGYIENTVVPEVANTVIE